jgi:hypothetical protein
MSETDKKWGHNPDSWMVGLTFILMLVGGYTAWIFYGQFGEMKAQTGILNQQAKQASIDSVEATKRVEQQLDISRQQVSAAQASVKAVERQMRQDQRPWVALSFNWPTVKGANGEPVGSLVRVTENQPLAVPIRVINTGRTAARNVIARIYVEVVNTSESPKLDSAVETSAWGFTAGIFSPNAPSESLAYRQLPDKTGLEAMSNLTPAENQELSSGRAYLAMYGKITYRDIFNIPHWTKFCVWTPLNPAPRYYTSKKCSDYNGVDNN